MNQSKTIYLTPPLLTQTHIKEKVVCIRAHRERIFNISTTKDGDKLICHNYGHGGAGWTFLFGAVQHSINQFQACIEQNTSLINKPICIIGAGCYGLLTAITLTRLGHAVRIVAQETDTLASDKAAGFFFPRPRVCSTPAERKQIIATGIASLQTYMQIIKGEHPFLDKGPQLLPAYYSPDVDPEFGPYIEVELMQPSKPVRVSFDQGRTKYELNEFNTLFINPAIVMQQLRAHVAELGITITQQKINYFQELPEQIIFNCAGMGAQELTSDKTIVPVQGHLITLQNQPIEQLHYLINVKVVQYSPSGNARDELIYFAPKDSGILGVTFIRGQSSLTANYHEFERLLERSKQFFGQN